MMLPFHESLSNPRRVKVLLPLPLGPLDYAVPQAMALGEGDIVQVPLGNRQTVGVVWSVEDPCALQANGPANGEAVALSKLKAVERRLDAAPLAPALREFVVWVAQYTLASPGSVLRLVLRNADALEPPKPLAAYLTGDRQPERMTRARSRVLALLSDGLPRTAAEIAAEAGVSSGVVQGLRAAEALIKVDRPADADFPVPDLGAGPVVHSDRQRLAVEALVGDVHRSGFAVTLLDGVPGSGKTEVYFEAVAQCVRQGRQALILLPEIALTTQFLERFAQRFGCYPAAWHSELSTKERRRTWRKVAEGQAQVVIGARSSLFLPFRALGLIIVDEEHEGAFKQEDGVVYHARDMAVVRASIEAIPIVLVSATPSLETTINVARGKYKKLVLPARFGGAVMPDIEAVDLREDPPDRGKWLSPRLVAAVHETLARGEQSLLFLNRRGYAPLVLCRTCGHRLQSPNSSTWLVEHRFSNQLVCHHSGFTMPKPKACPDCGTDDSLVGCGPGVERIAEEAQKLFPECRLAVLSSDTMTGPQAINDMIGRIHRLEVDLLVGTQVIAKGYHFPNLTLVGVVDADLGLSGGDLRASERTYQLLFQVAGRAGRGDKPGRVLLQTYSPENAVMRALISGDRDGFLGAEANARKAFGMPPFGRLASVIVSSSDQQALQDFARRLGRSVPETEGVTVFGPAPAPLALVRGRHRMRFLIKAGRGFDVQNYLRGWLQPHKPPASVRLSVDIDPYSFL